MEAQKTRQALKLSGLGAVIALCLGALAGCAADSDEPANGNTPSPTESPDGGNSVDAPEELLGLWESNEKGDPHLDFDAEGNVRGTDGCNGIFSTYTVEDDVVTIKQFASTLKACQGVNDWLRGVHEVKVEDDTLFVFNLEGEEIGQLERAETTAADSEEAE